jgi:hypothetical protein
VKHPSKGISSVNEACHFVLFYFVSNCNKPFNVCSSKKNIVVSCLCVLVFKFGGRLGLCTFRFFIPWYCISCHIGDNVSFKFGGVEKKYTVSFCCCLYKIFKIFKILLCFYFCLKFMHSTIEHTPVRSILDTGLRSSLHTLA